MRRTFSICATEFHYCTFVHCLALFLEESLRELELAANVVYGRKAGLEFLCQLPVCHLVIEFVEAAQICVAPNFASGALATEVQLFDSLQRALVAATTFSLFPYGLRLRAYRMSS